MINMIYHTEDMRLRSVDMHVEGTTILIEPRQSQRKRNKRQKSSGVSMEMYYKDKSKVEV